MFTEQIYGEQWVAGTNVYIRIHVIDMHSYAGIQLGAGSYKNILYTLRIGSLNGVFITIAIPLYPGRVYAIRV